jgi:deoxyribodipyrimidine photo-lyase
VPSTAIVWFRRDLRVHDHPGLHRAVAEHDHVIPAFVLDGALLHGRFPSGPRTAFLLASLRELDAALGERGGGLVVREGAPQKALVALAGETGARAVYLASDVSPYARARDGRVRDALRAAGVEPVHVPGNFAADVGRVTTKDGRPFTVFSPFHRAWREAERRPVLAAPDATPLPTGVHRGAPPSLAQLGLERELEDFEREPGEAAGRAAMDTWVAEGLDHYDRRSDRLADGGSRLSPYLHFGAISSRELEARVAAREGRPAGSYHRQLCWRDFYAHVLLHHPANARREFQARLRTLRWDEDEARLQAWRRGATGYPLVDAAMRHLRTRGWMPNRARLVVGSFLTKDLHIDWRAGEAHFMRYLLDGDEASNNGNWQWIAGVGVDPQPAYRRLYNPARHQERFDPEGEYVRRWVPELRDVPAARIAEPWAMTPEEQRAATCVIGRDYPAPIVDHLAERRETLERFREAAGTGDRHA